MEDIILDLTPPLTPDYAWPKINAAFESLQKNIGGVLSKSVAGGAGTTVLTDEESYNGILLFTGAITGSRVVQVPATAMRWLVTDATTGNFTLTLEVSGGAGVVLPKGQTLMVWSDGVDVKTVSVIRPVWVSATEVNYYVNDGTDNVLIGTLNPSTNAWTAKSVTQGAADDSTNVATTAHVKSVANDGSYTPTLFNTTNVSSSSAATTGWARIGTNTMLIGGVVTINTTAGGGTVLGMSLPPGFVYNIASISQIGGTLGINAAAGAVAADTTNNRIQFLFNAAGAGSNTYRFDAFVRMT